MNAEPTHDASGPHGQSSTQGTPPPSPTPPAPNGSGPAIQVRPATAEDELRFLRQERAIMHQQMEQLKAMHLAMRDEMAELRSSHEASNPEAPITTTRGRMDVPVIAEKTLGISGDDPLSWYVHPPVDDSWRVQTETAKVFPFKGNSVNTILKFPPSVDLPASHKAADGLLAQHGKGVAGIQVCVLTALHHQQEAAAALEAATTPEELGQAREDLVEAIDMIGTSLLSAGMLCRHEVAEAQLARRINFLESAGVPKKVARYHASTLAPKMHKGELFLFDEADVTKVIEKVAGAHTGLSVANASAVINGVMAASASAAHKRKAPSDRPFVPPSAANARRRKVVPAKAASAAGGKANV